MSAKDGSTPRGERALTSSSQKPNATPFHKDAVQTARLLARPIMAQEIMEENEMKKPLRIVLVGFFIVFFIELSIAGDNNFRKTKWGMSIAQVKSSEPLDVVKHDENLLGYKTSVIGKDVFVAYFFVDNQLVRARYILAESHTNKNDFIRACPTNLFSL
ncbi:MAG: hypothetical protein ACE5HN_08605 [Nitrospiria bacterium]